MTSYWIPNALKPRHRSDVCFCCARVLEDSEGALLHTGQTPHPPHPNIPLTSSCFTSAQHCRSSDTYWCYCHSDHGKHVSSTMRTTANSVIVPVLQRKNHHKAEGRGNIPVECGCLVHFSMTGNGDVCVFVWFPQQAATKATLHLPTLELSIQNGTKR